MSGTERKIDVLYTCSCIRLFPVRECGYLLSTFSGNFRATRMEQAVLTFLMMAPNYGQEAWTIQSDPGISEKGGSYSNMTSHHRFNLRSFNMFRKICHGFQKQGLLFFVGFVSLVLFVSLKQTEREFQGILDLVFHFLHLFFLIW